MFALLPISQQLNIPGRILWSTLISADFETIKQLSELHFFIYSFFRTLFETLIPVPVRIQNFQLFSISRGRTDVIERIPAVLVICFVMTSYRNFEQKNDMMMTFCLAYFREKFCEQRN